jgi:hypothetical protein
MEPGVSICPDDRRSIHIDHPAVVFCKCDVVINLSEVGVYRVYSSRRESGDYVVHCRSPGYPIKYIRVFHPAAEAIIGPQGKPCVRFRGRHYEHGQGIDVIVPATEAHENEFPIELQTNEEITVK